jgi:hypothetical protein
MVEVDKIFYLVREIVWLHYYGYLPVSSGVGIVFKDADCECLHCIQNLTQKDYRGSEGKRPVKQDRRNKSGIPGVGYRMGKNKIGVWTAHITVEGKVIHLGQFKGILDAALVCLQAHLMVNSVDVNSPLVQGILRICPEFNLKEFMRRVYE